MGAETEIMSSNTNDGFAQIDSMSSLTCYYILSLSLHVSENLKKLVKL